MKRRQQWKHTQVEKANPTYDVVVGDTEIITPLKISCN